jgi:SAM-dependent methyltransferase
MDLVHGRYVSRRRVTRLTKVLSPLLAGCRSILDVGCGDGSLAAELRDELPGVAISGVDVLVRDGTKIPVRQFDGAHLPFGDGTFDAVLFVDVLHHTDQKLTLLREAARVARDRVVIKDHRKNGFLAFETLKFMDHVGNSRHGVALPYLYWTAEEWNRTFGELGLKVESLSTDLLLYPFPFSILFDRGLQFTTLLRTGRRS